MDLRRLRLCLKHQIAFSMLSLLKFIVFISLTLLLLACDNSTSIKASAAPIGSTISIVDVQPPLGQALKIGDKVDIKIKVEVALSSESGQVALVVQDAQNKSLAQEIRVVLKGASTEEFKLSFTVPDTAAIHIFAPLSDQGQDATSTMATRSYKVIAK